MKRQATDRAVRARPTRPIPTPEDARVGLRVVKQLTGSVERRDAVFGNQDLNGLSRRLSLAAIQRAAAILVGRRSHQCHLRVMHVEQTVPEPFRDGLDRAEIDHVEPPGEST